jgi:hypothetical protein
MYFVMLKVSGMFFHLIIFLTLTCLWSNGLLLFFIDHYIVYIYNLCFLICLIIEGSMRQIESHHMSVGGSFYFSSLLEFLLETWSCNF